jgi:hypothetical protein
MSQAASVPSTSLLRRKRGLLAFGFLAPALLLLLLLLEFSDYEQEHE